jgi:hypothetical protein
VGLALVYKLLVGEGAHRRHARNQYAGTDADLGRITVQVRSPPGLRTCVYAVAAIFMAAQQNRRRKVMRTVQRHCFPTCLRQA